MIDKTVAAVLAALTLPAGDRPPDPRQVTCVAQVVYHEARGEHPLTQMLVAYTILDRRGPRHGATPCAVVGKSGQFVRHGRGHFEPAAWTNAVETAVMALSGGVPRPVAQPITHFHDETVRPPWTKGMKLVAVYGKLWFWRVPDAL